MKPFPALLLATPLAVRQMPAQRLFLLFACFLLVASALAQRQPSKDPQAITVVQQALTSGGGPGAIAKLQDFVATGQITYYWGGKEVQGALTIKSRGTDQFRLDAALPGGTRSFYASHGGGAIRERDGALHAIGYQNAVGMSSLTFPLLRIASVAGDQNWSLYDRGEVQLRGRQARKIHIEHPDTSPAGLNPAINELGEADLFIDPATFEVVAVQDHIHPDRDAQANIDHALYFSDFRRVNGIEVPFAIEEWIEGQKISSMQLETVTFNSGLTDSDFKF